MSEPASLLMLEFLSWVSARHRTYTEAMEAWRSTCPRQTVWEDALILGFIVVEKEGALKESAVTLSPRGRVVLDAK
jgi:hypothetical protein